VKYIATIRGADNLEEAEKKIETFVEEEYGEIGGSKIDWIIEDVELYELGIHHIKIRIL